MFMSSVASADDHGAVAWPGIEQPRWVEVFHEEFDFEKRPRGLNEFLRDFRQVTEGGAQVGSGRVTLQPSDTGPSVLIRPVRAGSVAELTAEIEFAALPKVGDRSETQIGYVLSNQQQIVVELLRERTTRDEVQAKLRVTEIAPRALRVVGEVKSDRDWTNGGYTVTYHHGLLAVIHDAERRLTTYAAINPNTARVAGVRLGQSGVPVTLRSVKLSADEPPPRDDAESQRALQDALESTASSARYFANSQLDNAQAAALEAVVKWRAVRGQNSLDAANALYNLAAIHRAQRKAEEAMRSFELALDIRRQQLGPNHPLTAEVHFALAGLRIARGDLQRGQQHATAALKAQEQLFGKDSPQYQKLAAELTEQALR